MSIIYEPRIDIDKLATNLYYHRRKNNLKAKEVAKYLNICPTKYIMLENGDMYITVPMLDILAQVYLTSVDTLLYDQPLNFKKPNNSYYVD